MQFITDFLSTKLFEGVGTSWRWFNGLSNDEWMIVLGVTFVAGMMMLRGMGKRRI